MATSTYNSKQMRNETRKKEGEKNRGKKRMYVNEIQDKRKKKGKARIREFVHAY